MSDATWEPGHDGDVGRLATFLLNMDHEATDYLVILELLHDLMAPVTFYGLCDSMEICPKHICDAQICADDQDDCAIGREAWVREQEALEGGETT
jgi:hypothetical protein